MKNITSLIVILISVGLYFVYISPAWGEVSVLSAKLSKYQMVLQKSQEIIDKRDAVLSTYNALSAEDIARLDKAVPSTFNAVTFANEIHNMANSYGLTVKDIKFTQSANGDNRAAVVAHPMLYKTTPVSITLIGPYAGFISFLKDMESSLYISDVAHLSIAPPLLSKTAGNALQYDIELSTYSLK